MGDKCAFRGSARSLVPRKMPNAPDISRAFRVRLNTERARRDSNPHQRALDGDQRANAGVGGLQLQAGQAVVGGAHPRAAVALQVRPQQAQRAELSCEAADVGDLTSLEPLGDIRVDAPGAAATGFNLSSSQLHHHPALTGRYSS